MKCLSLWQPWASAMAQRLKKNETRGPFALRWKLAGEPLLIHAAKAWTRDQRDLMDQWPFDLIEGELPFGAIICKCDVIDVVPTESMRDIPEMEFELGDYSDGRTAIRMGPRITLPPKPIPYRGQQGIFNVPEYALEGSGLK